MSHRQSNPGDSASSASRAAMRAFVNARLVRPAQAFMAKEAAGGIVIVLGALVAFIWANSPWHESYFDFWHAEVSLHVGDLGLEIHTLGHLVNDGLMAIFFFMVGLEIKREMLHGELAGFRKAALPVMAALGGMIVPALIFTAFNAGGDGAKGWGIPMATDIAFAVGVLALLGKRAPFPLKIFLLALAVADDLGAIAVIAVFYTESLSLEAVAYAALFLGILLALRQLGLRRVDVYVMLGFLFWAAVLASGIHATIAGVVLAFLTPAGPLQPVERFRAEANELLGRFDANRDDAEAEQVLLQEFESAVRRSEAPLERLERMIQVWVAFAIVPIFAIANAGVHVTGDMFEAAVQSPVTYGVMLGLMFGKPIGIFLFSWLAVRSGLAALPRGVRYIHILGAGMVGGVGFTVSLFVTELAFEDPIITDEAKLGILVGSILAAIAGCLFLLTFVKPGQELEPEPIAGGGH
ncbi:MAG: Na+/H+ antiporter NhaA [Dehalococcoidia bacterium]